MTKITVTQVVYLWFNTYMEESKRQSNFELLRIVAMILIIAGHMFSHGVFYNWVFNDSLVKHINYFLALCFGYCGKLGVDLFVMITGYFLINSAFKIEKFFNLFFKTIFYSLIFLFIAVHYNLATYNGGFISTINSFFDSYWFVKMYLRLYIFVPFINVFVKGLSEDLARKFIILGGIVWFILPTFNFDYINSSVFVFFYLYVIAALIRLEKVKILSDLKLWKKLAFYSVIFLISNFVFSMLYTVPLVNFDALLKYSSEKSIFLLVISIYLFNLFKGLYIKNNKTINWVSASVFGIYLIHDNGSIRYYLWHKIFPIFGLMSSPYLILYVFGITFLIFCVSLLIDKPVNFIFNKFFKLISQIIKQK